MSTSDIMTENWPTLRGVVTMGAVGSRGPGRVALEDRP
jgi:hypothetical protein